MTRAKPVHPARPDLLDFGARGIPQGARCEVVTTSDGIGLRAAHFPATQQSCRGTVILVQGRAEFIEKYYELVDDLRELGFAVAAFDWRGQGGSERVTNNPYRAHIGHFDHYGRDLDTVVEKVLLADCPPPYFAIGHSMGGAVLLHSQDRLKTRIERMVLSAPLMGLHNTRLERAATLIGTLMSGFGLGRLVPLWEPLEPMIKHSFDQLEKRGDLALTSDRKRHGDVLAFAKAHPDLMAGPPTFGWMRAMAVSNRKLAAPGTAEALPIPTLIAVAVNEALVSNQKIDAFAQRMRIGGVVHIDGARHEIPIESEAVRQRFIGLATEYFMLNEALDWAS